ncbi:cytochrome P450 monooxygenase pc-3 [Mycena rebaudengoi]|nr:cytochrome P450 monooxygenase pc-3 [Mycena rebaudengoi]
MPPPGVGFVARLSFLVLRLPVTLGLAVHYVSRRLENPVPVVKKDIRQRREAAMMGARLVPEIANNSFGNVDALKLMMDVRKSGYPGDGFEILIAGKGPVINLKILWMDSIFTTHPEHIKHILATDFNNYIKSSNRAWTASSGAAYSNSGGDMWKFHRNLTRPFFSRDRVSDFDIFDHHAEAVISVLKQRLREGYSVDFQDLIGRFTMDTATEFLFGQCVDSLKASIPFPHNVARPPAVAYLTEGGNKESTHMANEFIAAFNESMQFVAERGPLGEIWPLWEMFEDKTVKPMKVVSAFLDPVIHATVEKKRATGAASIQADGTREKHVQEGGTLLDELLNSTSDAKVLKDETLNILLAGRNTTMHTMTMVVYFLSIYPAVCKKLRKEVLAHVGQSRRPTYDDIRDMKYMRAVINESMRLYPPCAPFNIRNSINATTWPSPEPGEKPLYIPAGTKVSYSVLLMHRCTDLWRPDAEEFSPERFIDERLKKYLLKDAFQFLPFNAGPRICLGQQFAYNEMSFMLIRLLQSFSSFALDESAFGAETLPPAEWACAPGKVVGQIYGPKDHYITSSELRLGLPVGASPAMTEFYTKQITTLNNIVRDDTKTAGSVRHWVSSDDNNAEYMELDIKWAKRQRVLQIGNIVQADVVLYRQDSVSDNEDYKIYFLLLVNYGLVPNGAV